jgi:hypothetical protein
MAMGNSVAVPGAEVVSAPNTNSERKAAWECPAFDRMEVADTELGLLTGGDLIIIDTSS